MFDIRKKVADRYGEIDERKTEEYIDGLMAEFWESPEGQGVLETAGQLYWAACLMENGMGYLGVTPANMTLRDFNEIVFEIIPRKVSTEADSAPEIVQELIAFWTFVERQYGLREAKQILKSLDESAVLRLRRELGDPRNFGMAKSIVMAGMKAGYDMTDPLQMHEFMAVYNANQLANRLSEAQPAPLAHRDPFQHFGESKPDKSRQEIRDKRKKARKARKQARKRNRK